MRMIAIIIVAVLVIAAIAGAVILTSGGHEGDQDLSAKNWLDRGFSLELFYNSGNTNRQYACELLKSGLESLSPRIHITVTPLEWATYLNYRSENKMPGLIIGWAPDYADPQDYAQPFYLSSGNYAVTCNYANATLDAMVLAAAEESNATTRAAMYHTMVQDMYNESIYIWTTQATNFQPIRSWVQGWYFNAMYSNQYYYPLSKVNSTSDNKTFYQENIAGNPEHIDPARDYETAGGEILQNVYETLIWYPENNKTDAASLVPMLATEVPTVENGGITSNNTTYIFNLKDNIKFHDGNTMTAEDVKFSIDRLLMYNDPQGPAWMIGEVLIPNYYSYGVANFGTGNTTFNPAINQSTLDEHIWANGTSKIQFNLTKPFPAFLSAMAFTEASVVSKAFVMAHGGLNQSGWTYMDANTCGTGPFQLSEFVADDHIKLVRWDDYWRAPANFTTVLITQVSVDQNRVNDIKSGASCDAAQISRAYLADVTNQTGVTLRTGEPTFNLDCFFLNQDLNVTGMTKTNVPSNFFQDINVRKAFAYAFDYQKYIDQRFKGQAIQPNGAIPKGMFGYSADVPTYSFNLTLAAQYLKAAQVPGTSSQASTNAFDCVAAVFSRLF